MMDKKLKTELIKIFLKFNIPKMAVFEQIPAKKLKNAKKSYGQLLEDDEVVVLIYDETAFGSAKKGFILTNRRIHLKNIFDFPKTLELEDVVSFSKKSLSEINANLRNGVVVSIMSSGTLKNDLNVSLLNEMLIVLKKGSKSMSSNLTCKSCGASVENQIGKCIYCRTTI